MRAWRRPSAPTRTRLLVWCHLAFHSHATGLLQDNIFTCRVDPTATLQATASATESQADSSEGGGGTPGWVWALVAVAASAAVAVMGAVAVLLRRRRRQRRAQAQPGEADSSLTPAESPAGPPGQLSLIRTSSPEDKDLEKVSAGRPGVLGCQQ